MTVFTLFTAFCTPLPPNRALSPSRSSSASNSPVDAPEGAAPRPTTPLASVTSASTVGLPLESTISRPMTLVMAKLFIYKTHPFCGGIQYALFNGNYEFKGARGMMPQAPLFSVDQAAGCSSAISARFSSQNRPITFSVMASSASTGKPAASQ